MLENFLVNEIKIKGSYVKTKSQFIHNCFPVSVGSFVIMLSDIQRLTLGVKLQWSKVQRNECDRYRNDLCHR